MIREIEQDISELEKEGLTARRGITPGWIFCLHKSFYTSEIRQDTQLNTVLELHTHQWVSGLMVSTVGDRIPCDYVSPRKTRQFAIAKTRDGGIADMPQKFVVLARSTENLVGKKK